MPKSPNAPEIRLARARWHRRCARWLVRRRVVAVVVLVVLGATTGVGAARYERPLPLATFSLGWGGTIHAPGGPPVLHWPSGGEAAIAIPDLGVAQSSGPEVPVPLASLTKITVAAVVLADHPLGAGEDGPAITVTAADAAAYGADLHDDQSTLPVQRGEVLSERQALEGMLLASANNLATLLAEWDAGSIPAFVDRMNAFSARLGLTGTHFVDETGVDPHDVSTAVDVLTVVARAMAFPAFARIVAMPSVQLPVAGTVVNVVPEVGHDGVVGVKSGFTSEAGGCMVLAAQREVGSRSVLVLADVLGQPTPPPLPPTTTTTRPGQPPPPPNPPGTTTTTSPYVPDPFKYAEPAADDLLVSAMGGVVGVRVGVKGAPLGTAAATWGDESHAAPVVPAISVEMPAWPGGSITASSEVHPVRSGAPRGTVVGTIRFQSGTVGVSAELVLGRDVPSPGLWWRLTHR